MVEEIFPRQIRVRVEDDNSDDGFAYSSAFLIHPSIALLRFGDFIELYKVQQLKRGEAFEMVAMLAPFEVRNKQELSFDQMVNDASTISFGEFWEKYIRVFC